MLSLAYVVLLVVSVFNVSTQLILLLEVVGGAVPVPTVPLIISVILKLPLCSVGAADVIAGWRIDRPTNTVSSQSVDIVAC